MQTETSQCLPAQKQEQLIEASLLAGTSLGDALSGEGFSYEDLRYVSESHAFGFPAAYKRLADFQQPYHGVPVVSFFSGCGGLDLGFEAAGFQHRLLVEHNRIFCDTIRHNRNWTVAGPPSHSGDASERQALSQLLESKGVKAEFDGVFIGGPPCQPFSIASNQRFSKDGENFKRTGFEHRTNGGLLFDYAWYIQRFKPRAFLVENVPGIIDIDGGQQISRLYSLLETAGYHVSPPLNLNAARYSVPQQRERVFIIGARSSEPLLAPETAKTVIPCIAALRDIPPADPNHQTRQHKAESIVRYMRLSPGQRDKLGRVDRLDPCQPAKTVIAGGMAGGGRSHLHPYVPRTLTVRECARLQTFPDDYEFRGPIARQFTQVGNAVPPVLAAQLATAIKNSYFPESR